MFLSRNRFRQYSNLILNCSLRKQLILSLRLNIWDPLSDLGSIPIRSEKRIFGGWSPDLDNDFMYPTNLNSEILGLDYYIIENIKIYLYIYICVLYYIYFK